MKLTNLNNDQFKRVGPTIRATAESNSGRLFKSENNTDERAALVHAVIHATARLALYDAGIPVKAIEEDIDPSEIIVGQMVRDGYVIDPSVQKYYGLD